MDGLPGDGDLVVAGVGGERGVDASLLRLGQVLEPEPQDGAHPIQRVALAAAVAVDGLLDPTADLVQGLHAQLHDMKGVQDRGGLVELVERAVREPEGVGGLPRTGTCHGWEWG